MRTLTLRKAALVAALPLALSSLAACGSQLEPGRRHRPAGRAHQQPHRLSSKPPVAKTVDSAHVPRDG